MQGLIHYNDMVIILDPVPFANAIPAKFAIPADNRATK